MRSVCNNSDSDVTTNVINGFVFSCCSELPSLNGIKSLSGSKWYKIVCLLIFAKFPSIVHLFIPNRTMAARHTHAGR